MNREELSRQLSEGISVKTSNHQTWLKSQLEKKGCFMVNKKQLSQNNFGLVSFKVRNLFYKFIEYMQKTSLVSKIIFTGVFSLLVFITILGFNPLINKLSKNTFFTTTPQKTYAQQMLSTAMEKFNQLPLEKKQLIQSQLSTNLAELWQTAQQASDLQFFNSFVEYDKAITDDINNFSEVSKENLVKYGKRQIDPNIDFQAFRFTDPQGVIIYFIPETSLSNLEVVKFNPVGDNLNLNYQKSLSSQERIAIQKTLEIAIQNKFPTIAKEMQQARNLRFITDQNELKKIDFQDFNDEKAGRIKIDDESWNYIGNNSTDVTEIIYYKKTGAAAPPPYYEFPDSLKQEFTNSVMTSSARAR